MIDRKAWRFYFGFYAGLGPRLALVSAAAALQACLLMPLAVVVRRIFDQALPRRDFRELTWCALGMLGLYLGSSGLLLLNRYAALKTTKIAIRRLRDALAGKLLELSRGCYAQADLQRLHTVVVQDTERVDVTSNALFAAMIPSALLCAFFAAALVYLNAFLFATLAAICPLLYVACRKLGRLFRAEVQAFHRKFEDFSGGISFLLRNLDLTRLQTAEEPVLRRQRERHEALKEASRRMAWLGTAYAVTHGFIGVAASVAILLIGGRAVIAGTMTLGDLLAFFFVLGLFREQLQGVIRSIPELLNGNASLRKLHEIMGLPSEAPYRGRCKPEFRGGVRLEDVSFAYDEKPALKRASLSLEPGQTRALVGPNGSGKSTILSMIAGLYRPREGRLLADGTPYDELDVSELRRRMGVVLQDPMLFTGTIAENLAYGDQSFEDEELRRAARSAGAGEFVDALPLGYDSRIGENGILLSGGQRQKLALARALLRRPALLILDEPTNHLDALAARELLREIRRHLPDAAILVVSHDERVIQDCDYAYFLHEGEIVGQGRPSRLKEEPAYARLFRPGAVAA